MTNYGCGKHNSNAPQTPQFCTHIRLWNFGWSRTSQPHPIVCFRFIFVIRGPFNLKFDGHQIGPLEQKTSSHFRVSLYSWGKKRPELQHKNEHLILCNYKPATTKRDSFISRQLCNSQERARPGPGGYSLPPHTIVRGGEGGGEREYVSRRGSWQQALKEAFFMWISLAFI